ncbi:MAG: hypothetical protein R3D56_11490 [Paracoccaceae bacterium]|jgi:hypothetical protein
MTLRRKAYCRDTAWNGGLAPTLWRLNHPNWGLIVRQIMAATIYLSCPVSAQEIRLTEVCGESGGAGNIAWELVFPKNLPEISEADGTVQKLYPYRAYREAVLGNYIITGLNEGCILEVKSTRKDSKASIDLGMIHMADSLFKQRQRAFRRYMKVNSLCRSNRGKFVRDWNSHPDWPSLTQDDVEEIERNTEGDVCYWLTELQSATLGFELTRRKYSLDIVGGKYFFGEVNLEE